MSNALHTLRRQNDELRERVDNAERNTARTLLRATRLAQVISALGQDMELDVIVERAAVELGELFGADVALLSLGPDEALGHRRRTTACDRATSRSAPSACPSCSTGAHVRIGPADDVPVPLFLSRYGAKHVAWARLVVGEESLGHLTLVRRAEPPSSAPTPTSCARSRTGSPSRSRTAACTAACPTSSSACAASTTSRRSSRARSSSTRSAAGSRRSSSARSRCGACSLAIERLGAFDTLSCAGAAGPDAEWQDIALQAAGHLGRPGRRGRRAGRGHRGARDDGSPPRHRRARAGEGAALRAQPGAGAARLAHRAARSPGVPGAPRGPRRRRRAVLPGAHRHRRLQAGQRPPRPPRRRRDAAPRRTDDAPPRAHVRRPLPDRRRGVLRRAARRRARRRASRSPSGCAPASPGSRRAFR